MRSRIRIRIKVKGWMRIHFEMKSWIQIRIKVMRIRNLLAAVASYTYHVRTIFSVSDPEVPGVRSLQCCGSGMVSRIPYPNFFNFSIPDPNFFHPGSQIPDPRQRIFKVFEPKKLFLSSRKYDMGLHPGSVSQIRILIFYPSQIQDPDPQHW